MKTGKKNQLENIKTGEIPKKIKDFNKKKNQIVNFWGMFASVGFPPKGIFIGRDLVSDIIVPNRQQGLICSLGGYFMVWHMYEQAHRVVVWIC